MPEPHETRREFSAVPVAVVMAAVGLAVFCGIWIGAWAAAVVTVGFALIAIAALVVWSTRRAHPPAADAPHVSPVEDGRHRILVVADGYCAVPAFVEELRSHAQSGPISVFVMAPALESRLGRLTGDQHGYDDATQRLNAMLDALQGAGMQAGGEVGSSDPLQAADDGLRQFPANEIVFVTHPEGQANWLEEGVVRWLNPGTTSPSSTSPPRRAEGPRRAPRAGFHPDRVRPHTGSSPSVSPQDRSPRASGGVSVVFASDYPFLSVLWSMVVFFGFVIWIWILFSVLADVFRRHDLSGWGKLGWTILVIVLPFLGVFIYLVANGSDMAKRSARQASEHQAQFDDYVRNVAGGEGAAAEIDRAKKLLDSGAITQAEFEAIKQKALAAA